MANFNTTDLEFILTQILMAESNQPPVNPHLAFGLRQVDGLNNSVVPGQSTFGAVDQTFPTTTDQFFQTVTVNVDGTPFDPNPGTAGDTLTTTYATTTPGPVSQFGVNVVDPAPRLISNAISDISVNNPAAVQAAQDFGAQLGDGYTVFNTNPDGLWLPGTTPADSNNLFIGNITPDAGLSAPFNNWMTFFGQFFDHGLDLLSKGGSGLVFIPLAPDDPLLTVGPDGDPNTPDQVSPSRAFMVLDRATNVAVSAGADGVLGTSDDIHKHLNTVTPFVDQNQTYTSSPSHQVFLREYITGADGNLHTTGKLLQHAQGPDGVLGTGDDNTGMATWSDVKANALKLGILLTDYDVGDVPMLATDHYGNFLTNPATGRLQFVTAAGLVDAGPANGNALTAVAVPANALRTGHAFINDMARAASPFYDHDGNPATPSLQATADTDSATGLSNGGGSTFGFYDNELLDAHYIAGDGRVNENIALTTVHAIFHDEHNRLVDQTKALIQQELDNGNISFAQNWVTLAPGQVLTAGHQIAANEWNGERVFQAAKFGTETQYQHLVFEEFARKVAPTIHLFGNVDIHLDPAITSEFANAVYRFGHSMLDENVPIFKLNADGTPEIGPDGMPVFQSDMGLIQAFTNPLAFANLGATGAAQIVQGTTHQIGSEIDEFVTGALRNNLLGIPLDLAALNIARGRDTGVSPLNLVRAQIYAATHDDTLKPYANWDEYRQFLKHDASIINFLAAYGTHSSITSATTLADKRLAAAALVQMGTDPADQALDAQHQDAFNFMHSLGAYANDVGNPLAVHGTWSTGSITGLDNVDLWIGGLAEKQNLFGGLLGSTFNFIFETQLENLQDADRLYYLPRLEGTHWGTEIENNSFADMIMRNTGAKHLPASIFLTPEYTVEASKYVNPDGSFTDPSTWLHNPVTGKLLVEVLPDGTVHFIGDDNFFGNTMVLGGTEGDDRLMAGNADDDTVWGDGGNDWIDGGNGNDNLFGGDGDDEIVDDAGDDVIHADAGNDSVQAGIGDDIVFGGDGDDYIEAGAGIDEVLGGQGNDIILGGEDDDELLGNEGDDWIEGGDGGDLLSGDQGAPTGQIPLIQGNDVLIGGTQGDKMLGYSGDDIMTGLGGFDKFNGGLGFDWASWEEETQGVDIDMNKKDFIPDPAAPAGDAVRDVFIQTEGASGSRFDDVIRGSNDRIVDTFNELTNVNLIRGLDNYFDPLAGAVRFSGGNILLGGGGSDLINGGGGNDIIDGDARLHVELIGGHHAGSQILREILNDQAQDATFDPDTGAQLTAGDIDIAVFNDISANYQVTLALDAAGNPRLAPNGSPVLQVSHILPNGTVGSDGVDILYNIERLQFTDTTIDNPFTIVADQAPQGILSLFDTAPGGGAPVAVGAATPVASGDMLTFTSTVNDFEGVLVNGILDASTAGFDRVDIPVNELSLQWQFQDVAHPGWINLAGATGASLAVTDLQVGQQLRLAISYTDGLGHKETVFSAPTVPVTFPAAPPVNHAPTLQTQVAVPGLPDTTGYEDTALGSSNPFAAPGIFLDVTNIFTDDTTPANLLAYTATLAGTLDGANVDGNALATIGFGLVAVPDLSVGAAPGAILGVRLVGTPPADFAGPIDIRVTATDTGGLSVQDTFRINVLPAQDGAADLTITGNAFVGQALHANLGPDPDSSALHPSKSITYQWYRDGLRILGATGLDYTLKTADLGHHMVVVSKYIDGQGFAETVTSAPTALVLDPGAPQAPVVTALNGTVGEDGPLFAQNLLAGAFDPNGDAIAVAGLAASITTTGGRTLVLGTDYTLTGSNFELTPAGFAQFNSLGRSATDTVVVTFNVTDNIAGATPNTLTILVQGTNDAPVVTGTLSVNATEGGVVVTQSAIANASDVDNGDTLTVTGLPAALPAGVSFNALTNTFSLDPTNDAYQSLRAGQHQLVSVNYGVSDGLTSTPNSITFDVTGTNDAPTDILVNAAQPPANTAPSTGATIATLGTVDPDIGDTFTYSLDTPVANFAISAGGTITRTGGGAIASNSVITLNVRSSDGVASVLEPITIRTGTTGDNGALNGGTGTDIIYGLNGNDTLNGGDGDDSLFGQSGNDNLNGGNGNDTLDGGANADNFVYSAAGFGNDRVINFLDGTDRIAVAGLGITAANFAARVQVTADGADTIVRFDNNLANSVRIVGVNAANITIADFNFAPTGLSLANNNYRVNENAAGAVIDSVIVHDDPNDTHTFVINDDRFEVIDSDPNTPGEQLVLKLKDGVSLNYEAESAINLDISVFDSAGQASLLNPYHFTLNVQNVNEAPVNILPVNANVIENAADGVVLATLSATDPEGNAITYALADSAEGRFSVVGNQLRVAHGQLLDFETSSSHAIAVIATDSAGAQSVQTISVSVQDAAEAFTRTGTAGTDVINGTANADRIDARGGVDFIQAGSGNDYIDGGAGNDVMMGGSGDDTYVVDSLGDAVVDTSGIDTVITKTGSYSLNGSIENLINGGTAATFTGTGNASANIMRGGASTDNLSGGDGNDLLIGGAGNDTLNGGNQNDELYGGAGLDTLIGGAGVDRLDGGAGNDTMTGGFGNDVFSFASGFGNDRIMDFDAGPPGGQDLLDLRQLGITSADFAAHVAIADVGADVLITIDGNINQTIRLVNINDASTITKTDFLLLGS